MIVKLKCHPKGPVNLLPFGVVELSLEQLAESFHVATARLWFGLLVVVFVLCVKHDKAENAEIFFYIKCDMWAGEGWELQTINLNYV